MEGKLMGCVENITADKFPKQGKWLGLRATVIFFYGGREIGGRIVRDDIEEPFKTIIALDDGRFVLAGECQYSTVPEARP
jgi:hypothetical protein